MAGQMWCFHSFNFKMVIYFPARMSVNESNKTYINIDIEYCMNSDYISIDTCCYILRFFKTNEILYDNLLHLLTVCEICFDFFDV